MDTREGGRSPGAQTPTGTRPRAPVPGSLPAPPAGPGAARLAPVPQPVPASPSWAPQRPSAWRGGSTAQTTPRRDAHALTAFSGDVLREFVQPGGDRESRSAALSPRQTGLFPPPGRRGAAPACRPPPAPQPSARHGGAGSEAGPSSADTLRHSRDEPPPPSASAPLQQNRSSNAASPHTQPAQRLSVSLSLEPALPGCAGISECGPPHTAAARPPERSEHGGARHPARLARFELPQASPLEEGSTSRSPTRAGACALTRSQASGDRGRTRSERPGSEAVPVLSVLLTPLNQPNLDSLPCSRRSRRRGAAGCSLPEIPALPRALLDPVLQGHWARGTPSPVWGRAWGAARSPQTC